MRKVTEFSIKSATECDSDMTRAEIATSVEARNMTQTTAMKVLQEYLSAFCDNREYDQITITVIAACNLKEEKNGE